MSLMRCDRYESRSGGPPVIPYDQDFTVHGLLAHLRTNGVSAIQRLNTLESIVSGLTGGGTGDGTVEGRLTYLETEVITLRAEGNNQVARLDQLIARVDNAVQVGLDNVARLDDLILRVDGAIATAVDAIQRLDTVDGRLTVLEDDVATAKANGVNAVARLNALEARLGGTKAVLGFRHYIAAGAAAYVTFPVPFKAGTTPVVVVTPEHNSLLSGVLPQIYNVSATGFNLRRLEIVLNNGNPYAQLGGGYNQVIATGDIV